MSGRRISVKTNLLICVVAILGDWTAIGIGVAAQHRKLIRQDGFRSTNDRATVNTAKDHHVPAEVSSSGVNKEEVLPPAETGNDDHLYWTQSSTGVEKGGVRDDESKLATRYNFNKRIPSSYKLKYGGLGKRKLSSNSLRYSGLGKRLSGDERAADNEEQGREFGNGKHLFKTAYFFLANPYSSRKNSDDMVDFLAPAETAYDATADHSVKPVRSVRRQRSIIIDPGMKYIGIGKRKLKMH